VADAASRILNIRKDELPLALLSALFFFLILCAYFFLRPLRDAMGVSQGMDELRGLFVVTSIISLGVVLAFGGVVARTNRRKFIPIAYLFIIVCLLGFAGLLTWDALSGGGIIGSESQTALARGVGYTFFVWLSVINLFSTAVFWSFMVDLFTVDQGKRMFAFIGIGGTLGAIAGSWATAEISSRTESVYLPVGLMLLSVAFFTAAIVVVLILDRKALQSDASTLTKGGASDPPGARNEASAPDASAEVPPDEEAMRPGRRGPIGGSYWEGAKAVATSPYLLGIGLWIVFMAISNTLIYFTQANIVLDVADTFSQRIEGFGYFDVAAQVATLLTQMFITTRVIEKIGVGWTLAILPLVTMVGFAVLAMWTAYGVMAIFQAIHRATRYAMSRPARETLFSVVTPAEKYKAKPIVDVFLYRGGDVAGAGIDAGFAALGLSLTWVAAATVPLAGVWCGLSVAAEPLKNRRAPDAELVGGRAAMARATGD